MDCVYLGDPEYPLVKRLCQAAGIPDLHTHRFRRSYAMNAARHGTPLPVLEWTGGRSRIPETCLRTLGMEEARRSASVYRRGPPR